MALKIEGTRGLIVFGVLIAAISLFYEGGQRIYYNHLTRDPVTELTSVARGGRYSVMIDCAGRERFVVVFRAWGDEDARAFAKERHPTCRIDRIRVGSWSNNGEAWSPFR